jgi:hypothetical protein
MPFPLPMIDKDKKYHIELIGFAGQIRLAVKPVVLHHKAI